MNERNEHRYQLEQKNQLYILTTVLVDDKLKLICQVSDDIFEGSFPEDEIIKVSSIYLFKKIYNEACQNEHN